MKRTVPPPERDRETPLSPGRRRAFAAVIILFPAVLLAGAELLLRTFNYGGNLDLVTRTQVAGRDFYTINRAVGERYFAEGVSSIPEPSDDIFAVQKGASTIRIFCLGESTIQGFPYEYNATAPAFLRDRLSTMLPSHTIEVVNVGLSAVGSFIVEDFARELVTYEPDLLILYLGHNEFYGAYGAGSTIGAPGSAWMTRTAIRLLRFKVYLALRDAYLWLRHQVSPPVRPSGSLMGQMVGNRTIPYGSAAYSATLETYDENLRRIIGIARESGIPIMFSTLVSNLRDQKPFVSVLRDDAGREEKRRWARCIATGDSAVAQGRWADAVESYSEAISIDPGHAATFYKLGTQLYGGGSFDSARTLFIRAKDLDALRFRATEQFQQRLINICRELDVPLARTDSAFSRSSAHGITGSELILEHLHPNVDGYALMAKELAATIKRHGMLASDEEWASAPEVTDSAFMELSTVSAFDRTVGRIKVDLLLHHWPFQEGPADFRYAPATPLEAIVLDYVQGRLSWSDARYRAAEHYAAEGRFDQARRECRAVARVVPFSYQPLLRIADLYRQQGNNGRALAAYRECLAAEENPFARMKTAIILLEQESPREAAVEIERALDSHRRGPHHMGTAAVASAYYMLGGAYARLGEFTAAAAALEHSLAVVPGDRDVRELLEQVRAAQTRGGG